MTYRWIQYFIIYIPTMENVPVAIFQYCKCTLPAAYVIYITLGRYCRKCARSHRHDDPAGTYITFSGFRKSREVSEWHSQWHSCACVAEVSIGACVYFVCDLSFKYLLSMSIFMYIREHTTFEFVLFCICIPFSISKYSILGIFVHG